MSNFNSNQPTSITIIGKVVRCGCTAQQRIDKDWHGNFNEVCPCPLNIEELGVMVYKHKNPLKTLLWNIKQWIKW